MKKILFLILIFFAIGVKSQDKTIAQFPNATVNSGTLFLVQKGSYYYNTTATQLSNFISSISLNYDTIKCYYLKSKGSNRITILDSLYVTKKIISLKGIDAPNVDIDSIIFAGNKLRNSTAGDTILTLEHARTVFGSGVNNLSGLNDISLISLKNNSVLVYDSLNNLWKNKTFVTLDSVNISNSGRLYRVGSDVYLYNKKNNNLNFGTNNLTRFSILNDGDYNFSETFRYSVGIVGIEPVITDNHNGTVNVASSTVNLYKTTDYSGNIYKYTVPAITNLGTFDLTGKFIAVDYNSGSPIYAIKTINQINGSNIIPVYKCWYDASTTTLHSVSLDAQGTGLVNKISNSIYATEPYRRAGNTGLSLSDSTGRIVKVSTGIVYSGTTPITVSNYTSFNNLLTFYYHSSSAWVSSVITQYNNTQYDNGIDLVSLTGNQWAVNWIYRSIGDVKECFIVLGSEAYSNQAAAELSQPRNDIPTLLSEHCILVGRILIQRNSATGVVQSSFTQAFVGTTVTAHNDLSGLQGGNSTTGEYYHARQGGLFAQSSGTGTGATDGTFFGIDESDNAIINNYENKSLFIGTNNLTRLTIKNDGNVGIGIPTPGSPLSVKASSDSYLPLALIANTTTSKRLYIGYNETSDQAEITSIHEGTGFKNTVINKDGGNVGIGTSNPITTLHVNGEARSNKFSVVNSSGNGFESTVSGGNGVSITGTSTAIGLNISNAANKGIYLASNAASGIGFDQLTTTGRSQRLIHLGVDTAISWVNNSSNSNGFLLLKNYAKNTSVIDLTSVYAGSATQTNLIKMSVSGEKTVGLYTNSWISDLPAIWLNSSGQVAHSLVNLSTANGTEVNTALYVDAAGDGDGVRIIRNNNAAGTAGLSIKETSGTAFEIEKSTGTQSTVLTATNSYIGDYAGGNYTQIESDGTMVYKGTATVYDDVYPMSVSTSGGASAPTFSVYNGGNLRAWEFVGTATSKDIQIAFQIPHSYKEGSDVEPHIHLYIPSATSGDIKFTLTYTWTNIGVTGTVSETTSTATYTVPATTIRQNHVLSFGAVTGTGKTISSVFSCNIKRDPTDAEDTFSSSVWLLGADIHYEKDTEGSRTTTTK